MTNLHKIRARIRSVNSTQQITRTMKMIAVSKLRKTQTSLAGVRLFADKSQAVLNALLAGDASFEHPYLTPRRHVGHVCYVVFWGNRGLCGAYNQLLLRHLEGLVRAEARPGSCCPPRRRPTHPPRTTTICSCRTRRPCSTTCSSCT